MPYDPTDELKQLFLQNPWYNGDTGELMPQPTAESGYAIPEFAVPKEQTPQEQRANALGQVHAAEGFSFQVQPNGNILINNTPETRATVLGSSGATQPNAALSGTSTGIQAAIQALMKEEDPNAKIAMYGRLQTEVGNLKAQLWQDAFGQASNKLGVPQLEAMLRENEAADRADPKWNLYRSDSPATAKVRAQLMGIRGQVDNEAKNYLAGNTTLAGADSQLKLAGTLLERQLQQMDRAKQAGETKQLQSEMRLDEFKQRREFDREMKDEQLLAQTPDVQINRLAAVDPSMASKSPLDRAKYIAFGLKDPEIKVALTASDEELPKLAFGAQNKAAQAVLLDNEVSRTGRSKEEVAAEIGSINKLLANPSALLSQMKAMGIKDDGLSMALKNPTLLTKTQKAAVADQVYQLAVYQLAIRAQSNQNTQKFIHDLSVWNVPNDPEFAKLIADTKATVPNPTMQDLYTTFIGDSKGAEWRQKATQFKSWMKTAGSPYANSSIAPLDLVALGSVVDSYRLPGVLNRFGIEGFSIPPTPGVALMEKGTSAYLNNLGWLYNQFRGETLNDQPK